MKVILVGVNHAGTSTIRTMKSLNKDIEVVGYDRNSDISFLGCGIALWVGGEFEDPDGLFYANKEVLENDFGATIMMEHDVIAIDREKKEVRVRAKKTGNEFIDTYDKLVYAGGTWPITIPVPGYDLNNIMFSKIYSHAQEIKKQNNDDSVKDVVVIGAGYIGVELVEAFAQAGKNVTLIDMESRIIPRYFDPEFTIPLHDAMEGKVNFRGGEKLVEFIDDGNHSVKAVKTDKGEYPAQLVIMAAGFKPQTDIFNGELDTIPNGALIVDETMKTSDDDIYAVGDAIALNHTILGPQHVALATNAVKSGVIAGFNLAGTELKFPGVNGTNAISVFGYAYASTGVSEESAKELGIKHKAVFYEDWDRPEFMKNKEKVMFKIVYDPDTLKILGAQVGSKANAPHTEVIYTMSLAITQGLTLPEIALMDVYFLPHLNKPFNFMLTPILKELGFDYVNGKK